VHKSLTVLTRAVLIGLVAAFVAAPSALAAEPTPSGGKPTACDNADVPQVLDYRKRATELEVAVKQEAEAAGAAQTNAAARKAKADAEKTKVDAKAMWDELQKYLDEQIPPPVDNRVCAVQQLSRSENVITAAEHAITVAAGKIKSGSITVNPESVARGAAINVSVFCPDGDATGFVSDAIDFTAGTQFSDKNVTGIGGLVKTDASIGSHTVSAKCGDAKLTATFTVTEAPPVQAPTPTADDVRRNTVIKPKGHIETGGGATAEVTV
jgi:hypothetical protein